MPHELSDSQYTEFVRLQDFATQYGGADGLRKKIDKLEHDGAGYRQTIKELEAKQVPEGAKVLIGDAVKRWEAFEALGKSPEELAAGAVLTAEEKKEWEAFKALEIKAADVPTILAENETLKAESAKRGWEDGVVALAKAEGIPEESVPALSAILRTLDPKTAIEVKTEKRKDEAGKENEVKVGYVTLTGKQPAKFSDLRNETAELKGIRTSATEEKAEEKKWPGQSPGGGTQQRTAEDHRKAVTQQLDYAV